MWTSIRRRLALAAREHWRWFWREVLAPFMVVRVILVCAAFLSFAFPASQTYPIATAAARGWQFNPQRWLDMWARWDSGWYLDLAAHGYYLRGDATTVPSNVAFSPLYPGLTAVVAALVPPSMRSEAVYLAAGLLVSNLSSLAALALLRQLCLARGLDPALTRRAVLYLLLFPSAFLLSAFYTEALFLMLSVAAFYAAEKRAWPAAGLLGALATLTRPLGVLIVVPLAWHALAASERQWRPVWRNLLWLGLIPAAQLLHLMALYPLTQDLLGPLLAQQAWARNPAWPWDSFLRPVFYAWHITPIDQALAVGGLALCGLTRRATGAGSYAVHALLLLLPSLFTGSLLSFSRYMLVAFPLFVTLAWIGRHPWLDRAIRVGALSGQIAFMALWTRFYWVA